MKITSIALGLCLILLAPAPVFSQKIIVIKQTSGNVAPAPVRVRKFGRVSAFALPDQTLFPPYYSSPQPYAKGPDMTSRINGGLTSRQGSPWRGHINPDCPDELLV